MYEVDGVFSSIGTEIEERTQVIRMFFRPQYELLADEIGIDVGRLRRIARCMLVPGLYSREAIKDLLADEGDATHDDDALNVLSEWTIAVGIFVYGFFIFNITHTMHTNRIKDPCAPVEEEIWVTSFAGPVVNRIPRHEVLSKQRLKRS